MDTVPLAKPNLHADPETTFWQEVKAWGRKADLRSLSRRHLALALIWVSLGMLSALLLRLELLTPGLDTVQARTFGVLLSLHGFLMFYLMALPLFPGVLGQLALATWLPDHRPIFPRLAVAAWALLAAGGALMVGSFLVGGTEVGWSFDAGFGGHFRQPGTAPVAVGVLAVSVALGLMAIQTLATLRELRRVGMPAGGSRIFAEALGCASVLMAIVAPLMGVAMVLVLADAWFNLAIFAPASGGDPQLFMMLVRFFSGPAQNMVLLFALGTAMTVVAERTRYAGFDRGLFFAFVLMLVASLGGWGAEIALATSGQPVTLLGGQPLQLLVFAAFLFCVVRVLRYLRSGLLKVDTALVYAAGFFITAAQGLGIGLLVATPVGAAQFGNTQLAGAQFHLMMMANLGLAFLAGLHAYWTRLTGRTYADGRGRYLALLVIIGTQLAFVPLVVLGLRGASFRANAYPAEFQVWQVMSTAGATVVMVGLFLAVLNLLASRKVALPASALATLLAAACLGLATGCGLQAAAQPETAQLKITGMHCESCAESITKKLKRAGGVLETDVHFSNEVQTVRYDAARMGPSELVDIISQLGFTTEVVVGVSP